MRTPIFTPPVTVLIIVNLGITLYGLYRGDSYNDFILYYLAEGVIILGVSFIKCLTSFLYHRLYSMALGSLFFYGIYGGFYGTYAHFLLPTLTNHFPGTDTILTAPLNLLYAIGADTPLLVLGAWAGVHLFSYGYHFIGQAEYKRYASTGIYFLYPIPRILSVHLSIFMTGLLTLLIHLFWPMSSGSAHITTLLILTLTLSKGLADVLTHVVFHIYLAAAPYKKSEQ